MRPISAAVQEGAKAYLNRQYTIIAGVAVVIAILIAIALDIRTAIGFIIGGTFSGAAGFIGMNVSVRANARVAEAARGGVPAALNVAFRGGAVTGLLVAGLALLGVADYYGILRLAGVSNKDTVDALEAWAADGGVQAALSVAFRGDARSGLLVAGLPLLGVAGYYGILRLAGVSNKDSADELVGFVLGDSQISVFARLGGAIFT